MPLLSEPVNISTCPKVTILKMPPLDLLITFACFASWHKFYSSTVCMYGLLPYMVSWLCALQRPEQPQMALSRLIKPQWTIWFSRREAYEVVVFILWRLKFDRKVFIFLNYSFNCVFSCCNSEMRDFETISSDYNSFIWLSSYKLSIYPSVLSISIAVLSISIAVLSISSTVLSLECWL